MWVIEYQYELMPGGFKWECPSLLYPHSSPPKPILNTFSSFEEACIVYQEIVETLYLFGYDKRIRNAATGEIVPMDAICG